MADRSEGTRRIRNNATVTTRKRCENSDAESRKYDDDTRADFSFFTFGRRDVADLADVDEEEREEQDVPPHVELQEGRKITMYPRSEGASGLREGDCHITNLLSHLPISLYYNFTTKPKKSTLIPVVNNEQVEG